jgi:ATP-dependent RNA helicase SUPV3L1/SUV3
MLAEATPVASEISALLGPTNTGKTHRCIERMLEHQSGILGLPLRLLAREVYDRVKQRVGEHEVALVTGEEKRVPHAPAYWVCTVEAMPLELEVDFVGVDEIQLVTHPTRGHIFTHRLLHARGRRETWFLGSTSVRPVIASLVPTARVCSFPRLSKLSHAGHIKLQRIPPRSAVIAFTIPRVYEIAERLRVSRGGAAVVLGALSPRARNRQVALYESGEVDHLVATDAIGMGLNLDLHHVAFSELRKFDGTRPRALGIAELSQIAGRAGRHLRDGSFGTLQPGPALSDEQVHCLEGHHVAPLKRALWRNFDLDFTSLEDLLHSLKQPPPPGRLAAMPQVDDVRALEQAATRVSIRRLLGSRRHGAEPGALFRLWEVCQIPDYPKLLPEAHVSLVVDVFEATMQTDGQLDDDWMRARVEPLGDTRGDLDTLTTRLAFVRTWSYVSQHAHWVKNAGLWRAQTRAVEDRLSEALHESLTRRFVEKRRARSMPSSGRTRGRVKPGFGEPSPPVEGGPFAQLALLRSQLVARSEPDPKSFEFDALLHSTTPLKLDDVGRISYEQQQLARLVSGGFSLSSTSDCSNSRSALTLSVTPARPAPRVAGCCINWSEGSAPSTRGWQGSSFRR